MYKGVNTTVPTETDIDFEVKMYVQRYLYNNAYKTRNRQETRREWVIIV